MDLRQVTTVRLDQRRSAYAYQHNEQASGQALKELEPFSL
jgi:hypothetical protein